MSKNGRNIYIYGAGTNGKTLLSLAARYGIEGQVSGFIDRSAFGRISEKPVYHLDEVIAGDSRIVIAIGDENVAGEVFLTLQESGFSDIWWFPWGKIVFGRDFWEEQCISCVGWGRNMLWHVELHIMDACNLNCRGCTHFSPLFDRDIPDMEIRIRDVRTLSVKVDHIVRLMIIGGEPFLNPAIGEYALRLREELPDTELFIVTNGLMIPGQTDETLEKIKDAKVKVSISEYEPTRKVLDKIRDRLGEYGIIYEVRPWDGRSKFNKPLSLRSDSRHDRLCISDGCVNIWNGKIARCPTLMFIDKFNEVFDTKLPNEGIYDLSDVPNGQKLVNLMKERAPLCDHCISNPIDWGVCGKKSDISDFAVDE